MIALYIADMTGFIAVFGQALFDELNALYGLYVIEEP